MPILDGIRVVEWGTLQLVPQVACFMADLGADVIKVEHPAHGDYLRGFTRVGGSSVTAEDDGGVNVLFQAFNRNKRGLALDLSRQEGRDLLLKIIDQSDVFACGFRRKVAERLGLDSPALLRRNPRLVYFEANAYGQRGPDAELSGVDLAALARSGALAAQGEFERNISALVAVGDQAAANCGALGIMAALFQRERTGRGQSVSTSLIGATLNLFALRVALKLQTGKDIPQVPRESAANPLYNVYRGADGRWLCLSAAGFQSDREWPLLCDILSVPELAEDPRFADFQARCTNNEELIRILDGLFVRRPRDVWLELFRERDIPVAPVNDLDDVVRDPQFAQNSYIVKDPFSGEMTLGFPVHFESAPAELRRPAPELGAHTEEVLQEMCGLSWEQLAALRSQGVIGPAG